MVQLVAIICFALVSLLFVISERSNYRDLSEHDKKINTLRLQLGLEINNPLYWAELGELYFDRHKRWKVRLWLRLR
jgi:hypothetical protein